MLFFKSQTNVILKMNLLEGQFGIIKEETPYGNIHKPCGQWTWKGRGLAILLHTILIQLIGVLRGGGEEFKMPKKLFTWFLDDP